MKSITFENLPYYGTKRGNGVNIWRLGLFLVWVIAVTWAFSVFIFGTPNSFSKVMSKQKYSLKKNITYNDELELRNNTVSYRNDITQTTAVNPEKESDYENCDLFKGRWIPELNGPLYTNWSCSTIPESKNCQLNGRKDVDYMNWKWKPDDCELQRFDAKKFLSIVRGKKLAFIGDSVARNQMESLLCLLSQGEIPKDIYKDYEDRFRIFYFPAHDFTLTVFWTSFLVDGEDKGIINGSTTNVFHIHLDKIDVNWAQKLPGVDYAVISIAHWYFRKNYLYEGGQLIGCTYCNEPDVPDLGIPFAVGKVFEHVLKYINDCKECNEDLLTLVRTFAPAHFENGYWHGGGVCNRTSPYTEEQVNFASSEWELRSSQVNAFEKYKNTTTEGKRVEILDITRAMMMRPDGHPGPNWKDQYGQNHHDCLHWCLPGPIDIWNDLFTAVLQKIV
ncbi:hypothetical protein MKW98_000618 [Papaver atlanticum]|uniref:Trichome birefringence-like N-terminal domain-containing protein n=1 Tax=Papaver atlanticum TaxID=357466 RepID=A0AAD4S4U8_9MAGN|nr:hypothetical protein MKW98_000618 [Papaver atlanticum]